MCGTLLSYERRKARKPHQCDGCSKVIEVGETYHRQSGVYDGSFSAFEYCIGCEGELIAQLKEEREDCLEHDLSEYEPITEHGIRVQMRRELAAQAASARRLEAWQRERLGVGRIPEVVR